MSLHALLAQLPDAALVPVGWLRAQLEPDEGVLTVAQLAERLHRNASTVRGWCEAGRFADAFKLNGRDWRVPVSSLDLFLKGQRPETPATAKLAARRRPKLQLRADRANLGAWRGEKKRGAV